MGKLSSQTLAGHEGLGISTFRVRDIPHGLDVEGAKTLLRASLELEDLSLDSLASSSDSRKGQVATFGLVQRSAKLDGDRTEWHSLQYCKTICSGCTTSHQPEMVVVGKGFCCKNKL